jgi:F-type H+-transporting ATPase subunit delta
MHNPRLAGRYAKSLIDLAIEQNTLEETNKDVRLLKAIIVGNPDFGNVLRSPIINSDKKEQIINTIINGRVGKLMGLFIQLLIRKTRESNLPEILIAFIQQYNGLKNIHHVKLTTAVPLSAETEQALAQRVKQQLNVSEIELETVVNNDLIGGFQLEVGGKLVDASVQRDLADVRKQFLSNIYIHQIR